MGDVNFQYGGHRLESLLASYVLGSKNVLHLCFSCRSDQLYKQDGLLVEMVKTTRTMVRITEHCNMNIVLWKQLLTNK